MVRQEKKEESSRIVYAKYGRQVSRTRVKLACIDPWPRFIHPLKYGISILGPAPRRQGQ